MKTSSAWTRRDAQINELIDTGQFKVAARDVGMKDLEKAGALIDNISGEGDPEKYGDEYREALEQVIDEKIEHPEKDLPKKAAPKRSPKVIGLAAVLQKSLSKAGGRRAAAKPARCKKAA